ncbi:energy transducer TonB [Algiphilus sp.]|uniref:energy transducer TonB n=1 Tax=Algiphilus sp. TaxID=1872431 RepID=UPI003B5250C2
MRAALALLAALGVVLALFWVMQYLVLSGDQDAPELESYQAVDFVRVEREEQTRTRDRAKPEPPEPPDTPPPPPQPQVDVEQAPDAPAPRIEAPRLDLAADVSGGPFIGQAQPGTGNQGDSQLIPLVRLTPRYPRNAARDGVEGRVRLEVTVRPDGTVKDARVLEAQPRGYFEAAAVSAAMRGRFKPRTVAGEPVESTGQYTMIFRLE